LPDLLTGVDRRPSGDRDPPAVRADLGTSGR